MQEHETCCSSTMRVISLNLHCLEQGQHSYSHSLIPRPSPTSGFDCLQYMKQMMASYPDLASFPGSFLPAHAESLGTRDPTCILHKQLIVLFLTIATPSICKIQKYWGWQTPGNKARLAKQAIKKLGTGGTLGWVGTKANNTRIVLGL